MFERAQPVICAGARTPIGRFGGVLAGLSAVELGGRAVRAALGRAGVPPEAVEHVVMGHVLQAGQGQITARQAAARAGIPMTVPALTVNKVCLSGLNAIATAAQYVELGQAGLLVAGGMESMSNAPYLVPKARFGARMGDAELVDSMVHDGLWDAFDDAHMGGLSDVTNRRLGIDRAAQDEWAARSHERAAEATKRGLLGEEIEPVLVAQGKGDAVAVDQDEGIRPGTTIESLAGLRPAFDGDGSITAGNASQISDGGAAVVVMSKAKAEELGIQPQAELLAFGNVAGPDTSLLHQPSGAIKQALGKLGEAVSALDLIEINEAFAAVGVASMQDLGVTDEIVNVNGGAIALGHPVGMSGARIVLHLALELKRRGGGVGAAALCGGGGQGEAAIFRTL